jgi:uncharacterized protein (DUF1697 family)
VALLKGMNVGGNRLSVGEMRAAAEALGWGAVRTHLASGNLVFEAEGEPEALARSLREALLARGLDVPILVLAAADLRAALASCPFEPEAGKHVHAFFLWSEPGLDEARLAELRAPTEELALRGRVAWLHAPEGIGRSALAERMGKVLTGTDMTARNLNTVRALAAMLD